VPAEAPLAEPVQEDLGPLPIQDFVKAISPRSRSADCNPAGHL
jgi:hypothetical protein